MNYGYQKYKTQAVETMSKGEILIMLFEEANKKLLRAKTSFSTNSMEEFEEDIQKTIDIIRTLSNSLDGKYPISAELYRIYDYIIYELNRVKIGRNVSLIDNVSGLIKELGDTFREADKMAKKEGMISPSLKPDKGFTLGLG